ncbi:MAG: tRNA (adenine(22)-N(1))-methyltransferase TrmK [Firmicutes bacterium]|uniref:tRNA (Adenine22-N1)-methyltransferase n=1 Tax=Melghirimyces thermohalophilus TaxID=1236220 RepID=A0A1G6P6D6_9BACL|nr:tRNA (adenine(22)-N(1))-methyltransferase TrmK [Melghirimyces thermohalophilus]MDA8352609.1 tRNA (adenine(22)-N(1))-methyltransferase TrmK [Bacillota bacterium]SDC74965.1 tRNA (adenine22-N1)-methyltransferase [Melghirimyces thermohalophilus]
MGTERQGASRISDRLSAVARLIPPGRIVADIGSDHAQLLVHLAEHQVLDRGIAGEVNRGPYENAADRVRESGWSDRIDVRLGDGLKVLRPGEADVVVLAGMGGSLIASILSRGKEKLDATTQLVLQPNNHGDQVRRWLLEQGWEIKQEELVKEGGILYEIVSASSGAPEHPYQGLPFSGDILRKLGPLLCRDRHPLLGERVAEEVDRLDRALDSLRSARTPEAQMRQQQLAADRRRWEEVQSWLSQERI